MSAGAVLAGAQAVAGLGGLVGGKGSRRKSSSYQDRAAELMGLDADTKRMILQQAKSYDPKAEAEHAVTAAQDAAGHTLDRTLRNNASRFKASGGDPGGDTGFSSIAQRSAEDILNPLRTFTAERLSRATMDKIAALTAALGSGQGLAGDYLALSDATRPNDVANYELLAGGLEGLIKKKKKEGGTTDASGANYGLPGRVVPN